MLKIEFSGETPDLLNTAIREYVSKLKGTRGGGKKDDTDDDSSTTAAPAPLAPPAGGPGAGGFPGQGGATTQFAPPAGGAFPAAAATGLAPEVLALVQRINARVDGAIASGQPMDAMLGWFRTQCGAETANYTMDQIKTVALPKASVPTLESIAKLMNA